MMMKHDRFKLYMLTQIEEIKKQAEKEGKQPRDIASNWVCEFSDKFRKQFILDDLRYALEKMKEIRKSEKMKEFQKLFDLCEERIEESIDLLEEKK